MTHSSPGHRISASTFAMVVFVLFALGGCDPATPPQDLPDLPVGLSLSAAMASDGSYISWREHLIDAEATAGVELRGSDGLVMADLNLDGHLEVVTANKGAQNPTLQMGEKPISWFSVEGHPLLSASWIESE